MKRGRLLANWQGLLMTHSLTANAFFRNNKMCAHTRTRKPSSCLRRTEPVWESAGASETRRRKKGRKGAKGSSSLLGWPSWGLGCWGLPFGAGNAQLSLPSPLKAGFFVLLLCAPADGLPHNHLLGVRCQVAHLARCSSCDSLGSALCALPREALCSRAVPS